VESVGHFHLVHESSCSVFEALGRQDVDEGSEHVTASVIGVIVATLHTERVFSGTVFGCLVEVLSGKFRKIGEISKGENR